MSAFLLTLMMFLVPQPPQTNTPKGNAESGKALFMKIGCFECHGREVQGAVTGPRLNQNPITFARFNSYIRKPSGEMPPYTTRVVSEQQAADIYAYLQSLPKPTAVENIPLLK